MNERDINEELREEEALLLSVNPAQRYLRERKNVVLTAQTLKSLQHIEEISTNSAIKRWRRVLGTILRSVNPFNKDGFSLYTDFEKIVLNEPNDSALVSKYSRISRLDNDMRLVTLAIPHPLRVFSERNLEDLETAREFLDKLDTLPVMLFIHGLGGQMSQFDPLFGLFSQCADVVSLDLPGFGNSKFDEPNVEFCKLSQYTDEREMREFLKNLPWKNYETQEIVEYIKQFLLKFYPNRHFVVVGHSMGTHIATRLLLRLEPRTVEALVLLAPPAFATSNKPLVSPVQKLFLSIFNVFPRLFDFYRIADRIGGVESKSVLSYVYSSQDGNDMFKKLRQMRWNLDTGSETFLKYIKGFQRCSTDELITAVKRIPGSNVLLICGDSDKVTPYKASEAAHDALKAAGMDPKIRKVARCNHSLLLDQPEIVGGMVLNFIEELPHLKISIPWCLQLKASINGVKWGLKNELKWMKLQNVSTPIVNPTTGAEAPLISMKTLRETDEVHNPTQFEQSYSRVVGIVDIGSDCPAYDPSKFIRIEYHKLPTVSKYIPDSVQVRSFIELVDSILLRRNADCVVAVHCHYGFNRTGYLICCYLIERCGWKVPDAVEAFRLSREPGIKHPHFIDGLYLRYSSTI